MNIFIKTTLIGIIKILISKETWEHVRNAVLNLNGNDTLTGEEKRAMVIAAIKENGLTLASSLLNLAIEIAVFVLAGKLAELEKK